VDCPEALGCLHLLQDGATPAIDPGDVLPGVGMEPTGGDDNPRESPARSAPARESPPLDGPIGCGLAALFAEEDVWYPDAIAERLGGDPAAIVAELSRLELDGRLDRLPGGGYARMPRAGRR
jgi:DNA processing protein